MSIALALAYSVLFATGPTPPLDGIDRPISLCVAQLATLPDRSVRVISAEERVMESVGSACFDQPGVVLVVRRVVAQQSFLYTVQLALGDEVPMGAFVELVVNTLSSVSMATQNPSFATSDAPRTAFGWSRPTHSVLLPFSNRDFFNALATDGKVRDDVFLLGVPLPVALADVRRMMPLVAERSGLALTMLENVPPSIMPLPSFVALLVHMAESVRAISHDDDGPTETIELTDEEKAEMQQRIGDEGEEEEVEEGDEVEVEDEEDDEGGEDAEGDEDTEVVVERRPDEVVENPELRGMRPRHRPTGQRKVQLMPIDGVVIEEVEEVEKEQKPGGPLFFA